MNIMELINNNIIILSNNNSPHSSMDRSPKQKINKETMALNDALDQKDLTDIFRSFHPKAAKYAFLSSAHGMCSKIDLILGHRSHLKKYKKTEIKPCIFSDHNAMKLEVNHKKKFRNTRNAWRLNNILRNSEWVNKEIKEEINTRN